MRAPRRPDPRPARTRARILSAARELIRERGIEATTLQDVASLADVALGSIYTHFGSKDGLMTALVDDTVGDASDALSLRREHLTPLERIAAVGETYLQLALERPAEVLSLLNGSASEGGVDASERIVAVVRHLEGDIADAMAAGQLPSGDPRAIASLFTVYWAGIAAACARPNGIALTEDAARWALAQAPALARTADRTPGAAIWQCPPRTAA